MMRSRALRLGHPWLLMNGDQVWSPSAKLVLLVRRAGSLADHEEALGTMSAELRFSHSSAWTVLLFRFLPQRIVEGSWRPEATMI